MNARKVIPKGFKRDDVPDAKPAPTTLKDQALPGREFRYLVGQIEVPTSRRATHGELSALINRSRSELFRGNRRGVPLNGGSEVGDIAKTVCYWSRYLDGFCQDHERLRGKNVPKVRKQRTPSSCRDRSDFRSWYSWVGGYSSTQTTLRGSPKSS